GSSSPPTRIRTGGGDIGQEPESDLRCFGAPPPAPPRPRPPTGPRGHPAPEASNGAAEREGGAVPDAGRARRAARAADRILGGGLADLGAAGSGGARPGVGDG